MYTAIIRNGIFRSAERRIGLSFLHLRKSTYGVVIENRIVWLHTEKWFHMLVDFNSKDIKIFFEKKFSETVFWCRIRISSWADAVTRISIDNSKEFLIWFSFAILGRCHVDTANVFIDWKIYKNTFTLISLKKIKI